MTETSPPQPTVRTADGRREFYCFPAAILGFIINDRDEILLLSHPSRKSGWEVVNGAIESGESPVDALLRETSEEAGVDIEIEPVAAFHTFLYRYDEQVRSMLSIAYVATYLRGDVVPGGDMSMSAYRWATLAEIEDLSLLVPTQTWMFHRAVSVHNLLRGQTYDLEPWQSFDLPGKERSKRVMAAVLFTDLVSSTKTSVEMGDSAYLALLQSHDRLIAERTSSLAGRVIKSTGDGALAIFASVGSAVSAAVAIQQEAHRIGLSVRAGIHVGEVTMLALDVAGQAVVVASRLCDIAQPDQVLVSRTAADLLAGSDVKIDPVGTRELKGLGLHDVFVASK